MPTAHIEMTGKSRLIQHNAQLIDPLNEWSKKIKTISSKRTKTDEDHLAMRKLEWHGSVYHDETLGPYIPATWIEACLYKAGSRTRQGTAIREAAIVEMEEVPLLYKGPRDLEGLWANEQYHSVLPVRVQRNATMRCRPIFSDWSAEFDMDLDDSVLSMDDFEAIVKRAGRIGMGDFRPRYGRFEAGVSFN